MIVMIGSVGEDVEDSEVEVGDSVEVGLSEVDVGVSEVDVGDSEVEVGISDVDVGTSDVEVGNSEVEESPVRRASGAEAGDSEEE